jgi:hypothetical protein
MTFIASEVDACLTFTIWFGFVKFSTQIFHCIFQLTALTTSRCSALPRQALSTKQYYILKSDHTPAYNCYCWFKFYVVLKLHI